MLTMTRLIVVSLSAALAILASCRLDRAAGSCSPSLSIGGDTLITVPVAAGVVQRLGVSSLAPCTGEDITIQSEIEVTATSPVDLTVRICGLDLRGDLDVAMPPGLAVCAGFSMSRSFAPGTVVADGTVQRVHSPPGLYTLQVRHAIGPPLWISVPIVVRSK